MRNEMISSIVHWVHCCDPSHEWAQSVLAEKQKTVIVQWIVTHATFASSLAKSFFIVISSMYKGPSPPYIVQQKECFWTGVCILVLLTMSLDHFTKSRVTVFTLYC